jgi:O-antigen/teichoic acid export membrane protein
MQKGSRMISAAIISYAGLVGSFVASVAVSRLLGVEGKGVFSLFIATVTGLSLIATLGVPNGQTVYASDRPEWLRHFMANAVPFSLLAGGIIGLAYFGVGWVTGWRQVAPLGPFGAVAGLIVVPAGVLLMFQRQYFLVLHRFELAKIAGGVAVTLPLAGYVVLGLAHRTDVNAFLGVFVASQLVCYLLFQVPARRAGPPQQGFSRELARPSLSFGVRQLASITAGYAMGRLDWFIVAAYLGDYGLGIYSVAVALAEITVRLSNEIGTMLYPTFSGRNLKPGDAPRALRLVTLMAVATGGLLFVASGPVVHLLYGAAFAQAVPALRWLVLGTVARSTTHVTWTYVSARGRPSSGVGVFGIATAVDVGLNILLLPHWGVVGASIALATSYVVAAVLFYVLFRQREACSLRQAFVVDGGDLRRLSQAVREIIERAGRVFAIPAKAHGAAE